MGGFLLYSQNINIVLWFVLDYRGKKLKGKPIGLAKSSSIIFNWRVNNLELVETTQHFSKKKTASIFEKRFNGSGFYTAYASIMRLTGKCHLINLWKDQGSKQLTAHIFELNFNHEGVKKYKTVKVRSREIPMLCIPGAQYVELSVQEAAALLQDAYRQNISCGTQPAAQFKSDCLLLAQETSTLNRMELLNKLIRQELTPITFINAFFSAFRRMDNPLLYDLSSVKRKSMLGERNEFILSHGKEYRGTTFLKNSITALKCNEKDETYYEAEAYAVAITAQEEIIKIGFYLKLQKNKNNFYVDVFSETGRETIDAKHPDNPFNYSVFCAKYKLLSTQKNREWFANEPEIMLTGEAKECQIYKWLQSYDNPTEEFNISNRILCEYILTKDELYIFAKKPYNLLKAAKKAAESERIKLQKKYFLQIHQLYQYILLNTPDTGDIAKESAALDKYSGQSALIFLGDNYALAEYLNRISEGKCKLGARGWYFYNRQNEYYLSKGWLNIWVYGEGIEREIEQLEKKFGIKEKVLSNELENKQDQFKRPISEQKKWCIYGLLQRFYQEKNDIQELGLIAPLDEVLRMFGAVKTG